MPPDSEHKRASVRAEAYAPKPTGGSLMAGVSVGAVAFGAIYGVLRFYSYELADFSAVVAAIVFISTVFGFVAYKRAARRHRRAVRGELATEANEANRSPDERG